MRKYFKELEGEIAKDVYSMVLKEVELPLLEIVMEQCKDNQTQASQMLGINRGTLRNKLKEYKLL
jgi:Fis family transcriptional regulator